ncbi:MAG: ATP-binding protein [Planctomycetes bacterium]|nr:ATP-binding protein [Planctomycetota bacterium]
MNFHRQELRIANEPHELVRVRAEVTAAIKAGGFPEVYTNRILIAVDEAVTNIIEHGYEGTATGKGHIDVVMEVEPETFTISIIDEGETFDPRSMTDVDIERHVAAGRSGGLGVFLIRKIMDVVDYHHETGRHNRLTMVKRR